MSTLKVNTIQNTSGGSSSTPEQIEQGRAKVWVNFNGKSTVAIRDNFNVSSVTDNATGTYTINFSNAMSDTNYLVVGMNSQDGVTVGHFDGITFINLNTGSVKCECFGDPDFPSQETDSEIVGVGIFGDQ
tara:strand:+ start:136 stop:525 length:390 start_codon:yes stop_codon:yes gene_type:complete